MTELPAADIALGSLLLAVLVFGFAPGFILRLLVKIYPRKDPRRDELTAQLYVLPRLERPFFVAEQFETVLFEGLPHRISAWRRRGSKRTRQRVDRATRRTARQLSRHVRLVDGSPVTKIAVTTIVAVISFPVTDMIFSEFDQQFAMVIGVGAVVLVVQFLIDFEKRLLKVEKDQVTSAKQVAQVVNKGFAKINDANRLFSQVEAAGSQAVVVSKLVRHAAAINPGAPSLVRVLAQAEVNRISEFLRELADLQVTYEGEDREWLLGLTRSAMSGIDAIGVPEVDAAGNVFHSFWESELGRRYLDLQREAVRRRVRVRRVFVTDRDASAGNPTLQRMCRTHEDAGIDVRLLYPSAIPHAIRTSLCDFVLFDNSLSYEVAPAAHIEEGDNPVILHTRLVLRGDKVQDRIERYRNLWESAVPWQRS
jgi:hypothetical protein